KQTAETVSSSRPAFALTRTSEIRSERSPSWKLMLSRCIAGCGRIRKVDSRAAHTLYAANLRVLSFGRNGATAVGFFVEHGLLPASLKVLLRTSHNMLPPQAKSDVGGAVPAATPAEETSGRVRGKSGWNDARADFV
ncbi:unnamed protein product, partial [Pylaiella littoralis]